MSTAPLRPEHPARRPFLVPPKPQGSDGRHSPFVLWHLLSLDAPTVAGAWTFFIAWAAGVRISWIDPLAMFIAVWILYAADRLLDAKPLFHSPFLAGMEERHRFHNHHRQRFLAVILLLTLPLATLLHFTSDSVLHLDVLLACLLSGWLLLVHARRDSSAEAHRLPKELAVGLFFPAAVFIPTIARAPSFRLLLAPQALLMAVLCTLNCLFLYAWEHAGDRDHAHRTTRWAARHVVGLALVFTIASGVLAFTLALLPRSFHRLAHPAAIPFACALSGLSLLGLNRIRRRLGRTTLRALADFVLLTPIPLWLAFTVAARLG